MNTTVRRVSGRAALALTATAVLFAGACTGQPESGSAAGPPRSGGTLTFGVASDAGCLDPQQVGSSDTLYSLRETVDSLTDQNPETGEIVPWLAQSWEVGPDARSFTFRLRPGVTFSDGSPLDARVVQDNFDALGKLGTLAILGKGYIDGYQGTEVIDDLTARITFDKPNAQFLQATTTAALGLVSRADTARTPQQRCADGVTGSGSFVLSEYVPNRSITLTRRAGYDWGSPLWSKPGEAYLDRIVFEVIPEAGVRAGSVRSGQVDVVTGLGRADEDGLAGSGVALLARPRPGAVFNLGFNSARPITGDPRVRRALQAAVDRAQIVEAVFPSGTEHAASILSRTTPGFRDLSAELAHDPAKARALLEEAGWVTGSDGIRTKDGTRLSLDVVWFDNFENTRPALELVQQQVRGVGVELRLRELQVSQFPQIVQSGDFDGFWGGDLSRADPDCLRTLYSTQLVNAYRLSPSPLDAVLTEQAATVDPVRRQPLTERAQRLVVENAHVVPIVALNTVLAVSDRVHGLEFESSSRIRLHDAWRS